MDEFRFTPLHLMKVCFKRKYRIFHIHWPEQIINPSRYKRIKLRLFIFFVFIKVIQLLNKKVIWTIHNLQPHERINIVLEEKLTAFLYRHADGFISMNKFGLPLIGSRLQDTKRQKLRYLPHPIYKDYYPNRCNKVEARARLHIPMNKFVFLFIGQIRPYKNVPAFLDAFKNLESAEKYLIIAGKVHPDLKNFLYPQIENTKEVQFFDTFIKDEDLQYFFNSADLVVTPYNQIFNSGSVFLNLTFGKPTLAPSSGVFPELQKGIGKDLIKLYNDDITSEDLLNAMSEINQNRNKRMPDLSEYHPEKVARGTLNFYQSLLQSH